MVVHCSKVHVFDCAKYFTLDGNEWQFTILSAQKSFPELSMKLTYFGPDKWAKQTWSFSLKRPFFRFGRRQK